jgi:hypothetical protein
MKDNRYFTIKDCDCRSCRLDRAAEAHDHARDLVVFMFIVVLGGAVWAFTYFQL